jgi:integrase
VVLTREEVHGLLTHLDGVAWLMASLLYGCGVRLMECLRLRVKDLEFERLQTLVRDGKGGRDRPTVFPEMLVEPMRRQLERVQAIHQADLRARRGRGRGRR